MEGLILPIVTLSVAMISKYVRQIRVIVLDELEKNTSSAPAPAACARARLCTKTCWKNAMIPIVTRDRPVHRLAAGRHGHCGDIFVYPGLGKMVLDAINFRDYTVIQVCGVDFHDLRPHQLLTDLRTVCSIRGSKSDRKEGKRWQLLQPRRPAQPKSRRKCQNPKRKCWSSPASCCCCSSWPSPGRTSRPTTPTRRVRSGQTGAQQRVPHGHR